VHARPGFFTVALTPEERGGVIPNLRKWRQGIRAPSAWTGDDVQAIEASGTPMPPTHIVECGDAAQRLSLPVYRSHAMRYTFQRRGGFVRRATVLTSPAADYGSASTDAGLFYGAVTIWQLMPQDDGETAEFPRANNSRTAHRVQLARCLLSCSNRTATFRSPAFVPHDRPWMACTSSTCLHWHLTTIRAGGREASIRADLPWALCESTRRFTRYGGFIHQTRLRAIVRFAATRGPRGKSVPGK